MIFLLIHNSVENVADIFIVTKRVKPRTQWGAGDTVLPSASFTIHQQFPFENNPQGVHPFLTLSECITDLSLRNNYFPS